MVLGQAMESGGLYLMVVYGINSQVVDGFLELSFMMTPFMLLHVVVIFMKIVFMGVLGRRLPLLMLLIWHSGMDDCMVLGQTMESIGQYLVVNGVNSQVVDGFHESSFMMTPFMLLDVMVLFMKIVFMGVLGRRLPLLMLLIWHSGLEVF